MAQNALQERAQAKQVAHQRTCESSTEIIEKKKRRKNITSGRTRAAVTDSYAGAMTQNYK